MMKKLQLITLLLFLTSFCFSQISIDSIKVYKSTGLDSMYLKYTSYIPTISGLTYITFNDGCGTTPMSLKFVGCSTSVSIQKDTSIVFRPNGGSINSRFLKFYIVWDTSTVCSSPTSPIATDSYFYNVCNTTSIYEFENIANKLSLYPNPAREFFKVQTSEGIIIDQVEILDVQGRLVNVISNQNNRIDISSLDNGIYYVKLKSSEGIALKKIIVSK